MALLKSILISLGVFILTAFEIQSWAQETVPTSNPRYLMYRKWCDQIPDLPLNFVVGNANELSTVPMPPQFFAKSFKDALVELKYLSYTKDLQQILEDPDFQKALDECFPDYPENQAFMVSAMVQQDISGKMVAGFSTIFIFKGINTILARLGKLGNWINKGLSVAFALSLAETLWYEYYQLKARLNPNQAIDESTKILIKDQIQTAEQDIEILERAFQKDPHNPNVIHLLAMSRALRRVLLDELNKFE